ncbi:MAG: serine/threonine protein kinase, partial [Acidimicrobiia bacterium]
MEPQLEGYEVLGTIATGDRTVLLRARRAADALPVIVKLLRSDHSRPEEVDRLRREFEIVSALDLPGTVRPYGLERFGHRVGLVLEDFGGRPLDSLIGADGMDTTTFLPIAVALAENLGGLHAAGVIHKDVKPSNILVEPAVPLVKLADFGLAARLSDASDGRARLEGTLAYLSPEQTGRMDRPVDPRSDLYSLGVTFYEMLTGAVPFQSDDALEIVHCHLAVRPIEPVDRNPKVPAVLSAIVLKLLAKQPEDRYQSAYGLRHDLAVCLERWTSQGQLASFPLGLHDVAGRLTVPERLYGREREVEALLRAFDRVSLGGAGLVLVSGAPGVGKSALVRAAEGPISEQGGRLVEVKFEQYSRASPYASLIAAVRQLVRGLLGEPPERVAAWRSELLDALGPNVGVVADVVPELLWVMGEAPPPEEVGTTEAQNRFKLVLRQVLGLFARPDHPLVLFLDDLQWA